MKSSRLNPFQRKMVQSVLAIIFLILAATSTLDLMVEMTPVKKIDTVSSDYYNRTLTRAIYTFAIVRGINGLISVLQGTDINVSPVGIGVRLALGEALDPVNDLIERFSWVMLISTTSLGVQMLLMKIGAWFGFTLLFTLAMLVLLAGIWMKEDSRYNLKSVGLRLLLASVIIRFCIPVLAIATSHMYELFLKSQYEESVQSLEEANREIRKNNPIDESKTGKKEQKDALEAIREMFDQTKKAHTVREKIELLTEKLSDYAKYTINLIVVFILETVVIPLLVLWGLIRLTYFIFRFAPKKREMYTPVSG